MAPIAPLRPGGAAWPVRLGAAAIVGAGALALALVLLLVPEGPGAVLLVGALALGALGLMAGAGAGPGLQLGGVLVLATALIGGGDGLSAGEALYFVGSVLYLAAWYGRRLVGGGRLVSGGDDLVAAAWLGLGVVAALAASALVGNHPADLRAEAIALFPFLLFFPVKDAVARRSWGPALVVGALALYGLYSTALNALAIRTAVAEATVWYEVANVRFTTGETAMAACLLIGTSALPAVRTWAGRAALLAVCGGVFAGLLIAKSRGYWIATLIGLAVAVGAAPRPTRRTQLAYLLGGAAALGALVSVLFWDQVVLLAEGVAIRFASLAGAASADPSLLARYAESAAVWDEIAQNPILGWGWGRQVVHYSLLSEGTRAWSFVHNAYLFVWHKVGLWGLGLLVALWARAGVRAWAAARAEALPLVERAAAAGVVGAVVALALVALTSNPLGLADAALMTVLVLALGHGLGERAARARAARAGAGR